MATSHPNQKLSKTPRQRSLRRVPLSAIRKLVQEIAEKFRPEKIILFGSYAYGKPHRDSDVDLLVIMPAWNEIIPLDILVRTPENLRWRLEEGDWFLREAVGKGKVLYEKANGRVGSQSRSRFRSRKHHRQA